MLTCSPQSRLRFFWNWGEILLTPQKGMPQTKDQFLTAWRECLPACPPCVVFRPTPNNPHQHLIHSATFRFHVDSLPECTYKSGYTFVDTLAWHYDMNPATCCGRLTTLQQGGRIRCPPVSPIALAPRNAPTRNANQKWKQNIFEVF